MKLTKTFLEDEIKNVQYHNFPNSLTTVCMITLKNNYDVIGFSSCIDSSIFDKDLGEQYSYENAFEKLWDLYAFKFKK